MIGVMLAGLLLGQDGGLRQPHIETLVPPMREQGMGLDEAGDFVARGLDERTSRVNLVAAFLIDGDNRLSDMSVAFDRTSVGWGDQRRAVFRATLRARYGVRTMEAAADERQCPQIGAVLRRLEGLPTLRVNVPYIEPEDDLNRSVQIDGYSYRLAVFTRFDGGETDYRTTLESVEGSPISEAIMQAAIDLAPCWTAGGGG